MTNTVENTTWTPEVRLDLQTASKDAFADVVSRLAIRAKELNESAALPPLPFDHDGWYDVTPQMAEAGLMHSAGNREVSLPTVKAYAADMVKGDWKKTGETITFVDGKTTNAHHRMWAGYLSGSTFPCYVVVSAPAEKNIFAYYDSGKKRTSADALHIAGWNGAGKVLAGAITKLAIRYDSGALGVAKQSRFRPISARDVLNYMGEHPDFREAAQTMLGSHPEAVDVIRSKPAAIFFAWLVQRATTRRCWRASARRSAPARAWRRIRPFSRCAISSRRPRTRATR
jgi:hypothetical protein